MKDFSLSCPVPISEYPQVLLAHGGGGKLMHSLIEKMFITNYDNDYLNARHDSSVFIIDKAKFAFTTDSYVVNPIIFPGGDIGSLAIHGTVNDLAMSGAKPLYISSGLILEEGLKMEILWQVISSMKQAADEAGVQIITGDTKVVDKGKGDGIFINTAGIGVIKHNLNINPKSIRPGDVIIVSGDIGRHGIAIIANREGLEFETTIESDSAPLNKVIMDMIDNGIEIHCMRDLTRGGLGSALCELSEASGLRININESDIPVREDVKGACEMLGYDPLFVANEGRFITFVEEKSVEKVFEKMKKYGVCNGSKIIGKVIDSSEAIVTMKSKIGTNRIIDMLSGEQLPRIC